jgi:hypothetical protein
MMMQSFCFGLIISISLALIITRNRDNYVAFSTRIYQFKNMSWSKESFISIEYIVEALSLPETTFPFQVETKHKIDLKGH